MQFKERLALERNQGWTPNVQPDNNVDLAEYLFNELTTLSQALFQLKNMHLDRYYNWPTKPRDGDIILHDDGAGTAGLYIYDKTEWKVIVSL